MDCCVAVQYHIIVAAGPPHDILLILCFRFYHQQQCTHEHAQIRMFALHLSHICTLTNTNGYLLHTAPLRPKQDNGVLVLDSIG